MSSSEMLQQAVQAFQAGDRERARKLLGQVISVDPKNETAWYYLAAAQDDLLKRRDYLQRVLELNPMHEKARQQLDKLNAQLEAQAANIPDPFASTTVGDTPQREGGTPIRPLSGDANAPGAATRGGFLLPVSIPGAPPQVDPSFAVRDAWAMFLRGVEILQRKPGVYETEANHATWWRFWLLATFTCVAAAFITFIENLALSFLPQSFISPVGAFLGLLLYVPMQLVILYAAVWTSHWWAKRNGGTAPLYQHAYVAMLAWAPAMAIAALVSLVFGVIGFGGGLIVLVAEVYALYIMGFGFQMLYNFTEPNTRWITSVFFFLGLFGAGIVLGVFVGLLGAGSLLFF
jgi:hypothetical protein